jgi:hypothetical protein
MNGLLNKADRLSGLSIFLKPLSLIITIFHEPLNSSEKVDRNLKFSPYFGCSFGAEGRQHEKYHAEIHLS